MFREQFLAARRAALINSEAVNLSKSFLYGVRTFKNSKKMPSARARVLLAHLRRAKHTILGQLTNIKQKGLYKRPRSSRAHSCPLREAFQRWQHPKKTLPFAVSWQKRHEKEQHVIAHSNRLFVLAPFLCLHSLPEKRRHLNVEAALDDD